MSLYKQLKTVAASIKLLLSRYKQLILSLHKQLISSLHKQLILLLRGCHRCQNCKRAFAIEEVQSYFEKQNHAAAILEEWSMTVKENLQRTSCSVSVDIIKTRTDVHGVYLFMHILIFPIVSEIPPLQAVLLNYACVCVCICVCMRACVRVWHICIYIYIYLAIVICMFSVGKIKKQKQKHNFSLF